MGHVRTKPRTAVGVMLAAAALVVSSAAMAVADEHDDTGVECFLDDETWAIFVEPGDEITCEAWGLTPDETFEWEVGFVDLETDELLGDDGADDEVADGEGIGVFSFTVPADITSFAFYEVMVTQDPDFEESFGGFVIVLSDLSCAPDPVVAGNEVACEVHGLEPGEPFFWAVELSDGFEFDDLDEFDLDVDIEFEDLEELSAEDLEELFGVTEEDLEDPHAEGEGEAGDDGVGHFSFEVPEDTDATEYLAVTFADSGFGFYLGVIEPIDVEDEAPVDDADEEDDEPVVVPRPSRVDTGAGGTAAGDLAGGAVPALGALLLLGLAGAWSLRRRVGQG
jgi:hypothetical protein